MRNRLGLMYKNGHGVSKDYKRAGEWFQKAANQGHDDAQAFLGTMYEVVSGSFSARNLSQKKNLSNNANVIYRYL